MSNSLSTMVSGLMRAQMGASVSTQVTDEDLDKEIAKIILAEAKKKAERYGQDGIRAYLPASGSGDAVPRTNKRFLSSIIKTTDDHNKTLLRAQALSALEKKQERDEQERKERMDRAAEAASAASDRIKFGRGDDHWVENPHWVNRESKRRDRSWERREVSDSDRESRRRKHRHSRSPEEGKSRDRRRSRSREDRQSSRKDKHRSRSHRSKSPESSSHRHRSSRHRHDSPSGSEHRRHRSKHHDKDDESSQRSASPRRSSHRSSKRDTDPWAGLLDEPSGSRQSTQPAEEKVYSAKASVKGKEPERDPIRAEKSRKSVRKTERDRSESPGPHPLPNVPSKMDRYFEESYDPRMDVTPLAIPKVPSTGLITGDDYDGWDAMLELIRRRREDKEERKYAEKMGVSVAKAQANLSSSATEDLMNIEYKKKGAVREWDMGKAT